MAVSVTKAHERINEGERKEVRGKNGERGKGI